ncbi:hypothetical protein SMICM17S_10724 [Streptomyces microflavus]
MRRTGRDADLLDLYTGWEDAEVGASPRAQAVLGLADAVITGRYRAGEPTRLVWRGSANQNLIPQTPLLAAAATPLICDAGPNARMSRCG